MSPWFPVRAMICGRAPGRGTASQGRQGSCSRFSPSPAEAATYYNSRCGNISSRILLTFDDWSYGDPYRATRVGSHLGSRNIGAAFFLINQNARSQPGVVGTLRRQGQWVLNHTYSHTTLSNPGVCRRLRNGVAGNRPRRPYGTYDPRASSIAGGLR
jgi:peptidoglycan/xylan/chitin deacetylase (PgdA/CDA1 family)